MTPKSLSRKPVSVLFVCLGNICRSPLAEGIFSSLSEARGLSLRFQVDSAGTGGYHAGEAPDPRALAVARAHGVALNSVARRVKRRDMDHPGIVVAMDRSNLRSLERLGGRRSRVRLVLMRDFDPIGPGADVPDPYYGGPGGFQEVYEILDRSCRGLLDDLAGRNG